MRKHIRIPILLLGLLGGLSAAAGAADTAGSATMLADIAGLSWERPPHTVDWLLPAERSHASCSRESHYRPADRTRRLVVAGVRLAEPGLLYRFFDGELFAVEARLADPEPGFGELLHALTRRYGHPDVMETWAGSPLDSFEFRHALRTAGWFDPDNRLSLWLSAHDDGGFIVLAKSPARSAGTDNAIADCAAAPSR